jgi:hypothetical protein
MPVVCPKIAYGQAAARQPISVLPGARRPNPYHNRISGVDLCLTA